MIGLYLTMQLPLGLLGGGAICRAQKQALWQSCTELCSCRQDPACTALSERAAGRAASAASAGVQPEVSRTAAQLRRMLCAAAIAAGGLKGALQHDVAP